MTFGEIGRGAASASYRLVTKLRELADEWDDEGADLIYSQGQEAAGKAVLACARQVREVLLDD